MWDLIVSVPDHCLSFYLRRIRSDSFHMLSALVMAINTLPFRILALAQI